VEVTRAQVVRALLAGACSVDGLLGMPVDRLRHEQVQWAADAGVLTTEDRAALCAALASSGVMVLAPHAADNISETLSHLW
jgi:hypothetical protein